MQRLSRTGEKAGCARVLLAAGPDESVFHHSG